MANIHLWPHAWSITIGLLLTDIAWSSQYPVDVIRASVTHLGCYCHTWHSNEFRNFIFLKYVPKGSVPYKSMDDALNLQFDARKRHRVWWKPSVGYSNKSFWCHDQGRKLNKFQFLPLRNFACSIFPLRSVFVMSIILHSSQICLYTVSIACICIFDVLSLKNMGRLKTIFSRKGLLKRQFHNFV